MRSMLSLALLYIVKEGFLCVWFGKFSFDIFCKDDVEHLASAERYLIPCVLDFYAVGFDA